MTLLPDWRLLVSPYGTVSARQTEQTALSLSPSSPSRLESPDDEEMNVTTII